MKAQGNSSRKADSNKQTSGERNSDKIKKYCHHEAETADFKAYLSKLEKLLPFALKNKKLSKLEVISNAIDYIHDLRETLELEPCNTAFDIDTMSQCGNVQYSSDPEISSKSKSYSISQISTPSRVLQSGPVLTPYI